MKLLDRIEEWWFIITKNKYPYLWILFDDDGSATNGMILIRIFQLLSIAGILVFLWIRF